MNLGLYVSFPHLLKKTCPESRFQYHLIGSAVGELSEGPGAHWLLLRAGELPVQGFLCMPRAWRTRTSLPSLPQLGQGSHRLDRGVCTVPRLLDVCPWSSCCSSARTPAGMAVQGQHCWGPRCDAHLPDQPQAAPGSG